GRRLGPHLIRRTATGVLEGSDQKDRTTTRPASGAVAKRNDWNVGLPVGGTAPVLPYRTRCCRRLAPSLRTGGLRRILEVNLTRVSDVRRDRAVRNWISYRVGAIDTERACIKPGVVGDRVADISTASCEERIGIGMQ